MCLTGCAASRVTRLGEFSPIGWLLTLGQCSPHFWVLFSTVKDVHIFYKNVFGYVLNSFGHPAASCRQLLPTDVNNSPENKSDAFDTDTYLGKWCKIKWTEFHFFLPRDVEKAIEHEIMYIHVWNNFANKFCADEHFCFENYIFLLLQDQVCT
jgi:hypothetical protein